MNVIKNIFSEKSDEEVHSDFVKFGKGRFENKYLIYAKRQKDVWKIKTSAEFANFFVRKCLKKASGKIKVKGIIVYTKDIKDKVGFDIEKVKNFMGIRQIVINTEVFPDEILELMKEYPKAFFALSFTTPSCELKIKPKAPKSAKPASRGEKEPKADFCSLKTSDKSIIDELFFDFPDFKEIKIRHIIEIKEIILPEGVEEPVKIRELSKRRGIIKRVIEVDGRKAEKEAEFVA